MFGLSTIPSDRKSAAATQEADHLKPVDMRNGVEIFSLLPRDSMHKRGKCRRDVSVRPSVCPSLTFVHFVKTSNDFLKLFHR